MDCHGLAALASFDRPTWEREMDCCGFQRLWEALALMMSGGGRVADRLPGAYELSEHRLQSILTPTQAIESLS